MGYRLSNILLGQIRLEATHAINPLNPNRKQTHNCLIICDPNHTSEVIRCILEKQTPSKLTYGLVWLTVLVKRF